MDSTKTFRPRSAMKALPERSSIFQINTARFSRRVDPDYSTPEAKFAYIFRYTTAHADFLDAVIRQCAEIGAQTKQPSLIVSCIGGGPGSDILGFVKYLLPISPKPHLTFFRQRLELGRCLV